MPELVGCRLGAAIARVIAVEKNAGAECFVVGEQAGNSAIDPPDIDAYAEFKLKERYNVGDRAQAQSEPLSQIECILFSLGADIARENRSFRRIVAQRLNAKKLL